MAEVLSLAPEPLSMNSTNQEILKKLAGVVTIVPSQLVDALLALHEKLDGKGIKWIVNGDLGECLRAVDVHPDCIEILISKEDTAKFFQEVQEFKPQPINLKMETLSRKAILDGKEFPVYIRSLYFEFNLNGVKVKVHGNFQFKVGNWEWGEIFDFKPEIVNIVGKEIVVTPLPIRYELYQCLGWNDRKEKVKQVLKRTPYPKIRQF